MYSLLLSIATVVVILLVASWLVPSRADFDEWGDDDDL